MTDYTNATLPTPLTESVIDAGSHADMHARLDDLQHYMGSSGRLANHARQLERDAMTMALRLWGEDESTFSPETREVMKRWRPRVEALLNGEQSAERGKE